MTRHNKKIFYTLYQEVCQSTLEKSLFGIGRHEIQMAQNFERSKTDVRPTLEGTYRR